MVVADASSRCPARPRSRDDQQASARNLLHYLALRSHDLRGAQPLLASHGLSSLGRTESRRPPWSGNGVEGPARAGRQLVDTLMDSAPLTKDAVEVLLAAQHRGAPRPGAGRARRADYGDDAGRRGSDYPLFAIWWQPAWIACGLIASTCTYAADLGANGRSPRAGRTRSSIARAASRLHRGSKLRDRPDSKTRPAPGDQDSDQSVADAFGCVTRPAVVALVVALHRAPSRPPSSAWSVTRRRPRSLVDEPDQTIAFEDARGKGHATSA